MQEIHNKSVAIIGSGSWATAIVKILQNNKVNLHWWVRNDEVIDYINSFGHNPNYLSSVELNTSIITISSNLQEILKEVEIIILAIPSAFVESVFINLESSHFSNKIIVSAIKGFITQTNLLPAKFMELRFGIKPENFCIVCGPCHAEEVAMERLSYLTFASVDSSIANMIAQLFQCRFIKTIVSTDSEGSEYAAVLKNIYALASGVAAGLGYGDNFQAVLISNAIREIERFTNTTNNSKRDIKNSAYLGDLLVTAYSNFSRNRIFGTMIGKGYSVKSAKLEMKMIAEGYFALKSMYEINKNENVNMPILKTMYQIFYEEKNPRKSFQELCNLLT